MIFKTQKTIIKLILICFIAAISPYANPSLNINKALASLDDINQVSEVENIDQYLEQQNNPLSTITEQPQSTSHFINSTLELIQDEVAIPNISNDFRTWASTIQPLEEELDTEVYEKIQKVDTLIETQRVIEMNNKILEEVAKKYNEINNLRNSNTTTTINDKVITIPNPKYNSNEYSYIKHIYDHYQNQSISLKELFNFNQVFECLMIKAEIGAEVDGEMLSHEEFVSKASGEGLIACPPGPNYQKSLSKKSESSDNPTSEPVEISDTTTSENQAPPMALNNKQSIYSKLISKIIPKAFASKSEPSMPSSPYSEAMSDAQELLDISAPYFENPDPESQEIKNLQNNINNIPEPKSGNPPTQEFLPPPLEFENPAEIKLLLPQTLAEYNTFYKQGKQVDQRIYYLLYHVFQTMQKEGETYERYLADKVIQDASTPGQIKIACSKNIEDNPEKCDNVANLCGVLSTEYFVTDLMFGNIVDNIGVPYKDRAHLKIWLGLNAPLKSDEIGEEDSSIYNSHYDLKAIDFSEIGLYNESIDCAACGDMVSCKSLTAVFFAAVIAMNPAYAVLISTVAATGNAIPLVNIYMNTEICLNLCKVPLLWGSLCRPCCPPILDSANPNTIPVKVKWQNEDYGSVASDLAGGLLDEVLPFDEENGFSINNMLNGLAQGALEQLFDSGFKDFDVAKLAQGGFENFMAEMGNQWIDEKIFGKLGLPEGFASSVNWLNPNPEALITSITGNYLDENLGLEFGSFTPIVSAMMSGDFKEAALSALNFTPNLDLPPKLQEAMNIAIQNGNNSEAMGLAFANLGLKEINSNLLGFPEGILDLDSFSGEGFIGIANKLGQHGIAQIEGLPTNFIFDINNPKNTAMSLGSSLLSDVTDNQKINQAITTAISQGENFSLNSALQLMETEDLSQIFNLDNTDAQLIKDFLNNPTSTPFVAFRNTMLEKIDFESAALKNLNFTPESLELLFDYGLNPAYSDNSSNVGSLMMATLSNSIKLDKFGIELNKTDIEKLAYIQEYIQITNNLPNQPTQTNSYFGLNFNNTFYNPELNQISQDFTTRFGYGESISQFHNRLLTTIDETVENPESEAASTVNKIKYLVQPIKIQFSERIKKDELIDYDYIDTSIPDASQNSNTGINPTQSELKGALRSLNIDLNSLEIVHSSIYEQKTNDYFSENQNSNLIPFSSSFNFNGINPYIYNNPNTDYYIPGEVYYAYPKIDLAELALPGIRNENFQDQTGAFKLLDTSTNITKNALENPIIITPLPKNDPRINTVLSNDPLKTAFLKKYQVEYTQPDGTKSVFDPVTLYGGSENIYNTLNNIGTSKNQSSSTNLTDIGTMVISSAMTGIDIATLLDKNLDTTELQGKLEQFTNAMGIVKSWQTGDIDSGIKSSVGFLKDNGIFDNISENSSWNISEDGSISIEGIDLLGMYDNISSGNYQATLEGIPAIQDKFSELSDTLGTNPFNLIDLAQNFTPEKASDTVLDIMSNNIASETGLEKIAIAQELTSTLGVPPDPKNIPNLLQSSYFQENVLSDVDPELLGDISGIYGLVAGGNITPQKAVSTIMTANFFQEAIGKEAFGEFMGDYGGMINAALTGDPQAIANSIMSSPKVADKLTEFFTDKGISEYFDIAGIQGLINGDIEGFIKQTSMKFLDKHLLSKLDGPLGGLMGDSILSILNGEFPSEALMQFASEYLIKEFLGADSSILQSLGGSFTNGFTLSPAFAISIAGDMLNSAVAGAIFTKCKGKIAKDNIIHFLDMVLAYDRNKTAHLKYDITMTDEDGKIIEATDENGFPIDNSDTNSLLIDNPKNKIKRYYPLQIFSDFASTIEDKVASKANEKFSYIWYEDRFDFLNVFIKECEDRQNPFLTNCEDAIHIGF